MSLLLPPIPIEFEGNVRARVSRVKKLFSIISVKAKSFADREIRYTLKAQGQGAAGTFNIGPTSGIVKLAKELDFEDLRQPHIYSLIVTATEDSGGFSTSVEVTEFMLVNFVVSPKNNNSLPVGKYSTTQVPRIRTLLPLLVERNKLTSHFRKLTLRRLLRYDSVFLANNSSVRRER